MKKISVIVPIYNVEKYLENCVSSIIKQTYTNLEIILVDDGSTDSSKIICDDLAAKDSRIKVIHKENGGLSSARNEGMKIATGELIGFVDSDDYIIPEFYEYLYDMLEKNNADISEGKFLRISEELMSNAERILIDKNNEVKIEEIVSNNLDALYTLYGINEEEYVQKVVVWNKLYKKELFENIIFPEGRLHEDEFTTYKLLYKSKKIVSSNKFIHGYMQTQKSIMRTEIKQKRIDDCLESILSSLEFFHEKNMYELETKIMMRYLDICIELSWKISNQNSDTKKQKLEYIKEKYKLFFENNMKYYKEYVSTKLDKHFFNLLELAYYSACENHGIKDFYDRLKVIKE